MESVQFSKPLVFQCMSTERYIDVLCIQATAQISVSIERYNY